MFLENAAVLANARVAENKYLMKVVSPKTVGAAKPGQFYMLRCKDDYFTLRRPVSVHGADALTNVLEFYYEVKGAGTRDLAGFAPADGIEIQGPLGKGFTTAEKGRELLVVGGGMGLAPMKYLTEILKRDNNVTLVAGGRDAEALRILSNFDLTGISVFVTTDDGAVGAKGTVIPKVSELLSEKKYDRIYVCGPAPMMILVGQLALAERVPCEISMESRMACGVKACVGCSFLTNEGMKKVCADGPVFDGTLIREINNTEQKNCGTCGCAGEVK
ncbi:MAG: dihydroorotate dehydrogenase electron transfer subunit [Fusobacteriaceae bacterium]|jgi:dihydroorotate dehydrogenase electron transfer subunit|nr:dihydroorotate dehydrogenase electron transfer subunit [Fusobacteriaceae bacterium]